MATTTRRKFKGGLSGFKKAVEKSLVKRGMAAAEAARVVKDADYVIEKDWNNGRTPAYFVRSYVSGNPIVKEGGGFKLSQEKVDRMMTEMRSKVRPRDTGSSWAAIKKMFGF